MRAFKHAVRCYVLPMSADRGSKGGRVVVRPEAPFNGVKIFSATMFADRDALGGKVTDWIANHPECQITEIIQTQSSDMAFHCITLTVFYRH
jgi:hypothetical protein